MTFKISKMLLLILGAYVLTFLQSHWHGPRLCLGFQPDLTPALLVFVGMTMGAGYVSSLALVSGLWLDSLSANPFGISVFPLFLPHFRLWYSFLTKFYSLTVHL
jgi:cell shape-determining protein MreD